MSDRPRVTPLGEGRFDVDDGQTRTTAYGVVDGPRTWIFIDGQTYLVDAAGGHDGRHRAGHATERDDAALAAPMPATVVDVNVQAGARVARGDLLMTLEAMKMELPIVAPRDGVVRAVNCRKGELVQPGLPLVVLA